MRGTNWEQLAEPREIPRLPTATVGPRAATPAARRRAHRHICRGSPLRRVSGPSPPGTADAGGRASAAPATQHPTWPSIVIPFPWPKAAAPGVAAFLLILLAGG